MSSTPEGIVYLAMSLDGFIAGPDGDMAWLDEAAGSGEDTGFEEHFNSIDALILGRASHDFVRSFGQWPYGDKRCLVMSRSKGETMANEEFFSGSPAELMEKMEGEGRKRLYIDGGGLVRAFMREGFIQEIAITMIPIILGKGIALFSEEVPRRKLELMDSKQFAWCR